MSLLVWAIVIVLGLMTSALLLVALAAISDVDQRLEAAERELSTLRSEDGLT